MIIFLEVGDDDEVDDGGGGEEVGVGCCSSNDDEEDDDDDGGGVFILDDEDVSFMVELLFFMHNKDHGSFLLHWMRRLFPVSALFRICCRYTFIQPKQ